MSTGWTETDSRDFLDHGDLFVPRRDMQLDILCELLGSGTSERGTVVDLGCGQGLLTAEILARFPGLEVVAVDASETMLDATVTTAGAAASRLRRLHCRLEEFSGAVEVGPLAGVVSSLAIHHLDGPGKRRLFAEVAGRLRPGGVFAVADIVEPASEAARRLAARLWDAEVQRLCSERAEGRHALERFRADGWNHFAVEEPDPVDHPSSLEEQLRWLREAGFVGVDAVWMFAGHAIFAGHVPRDDP